MEFDSIMFGGGGLFGNLSKQMGAIFENSKLILPKHFGEGYGKIYNFDSSIKMMVYEYELAKSFTLKKPGEQRGKDFITFSFRNLFHPKNTETKFLPSVQVSSGDIDLEINVPPNVKLNTILIILHVDFLKLIFNKNKGNRMLENIFSGNKSYLYEQFISTEMQKIASQIFEVNSPEELSDFYLKLKAEELIYLFFVELLKRENIDNYPVNATDIKLMYLIRDKIISTISVPPNLKELAQLANMSESKMSRLFKQIFGNSIYNYYQSVRMNEAARLLKEHKLSVSEVGYLMGFANLSHFSRVFEEHIGIKPKKYSATFVS